MSASAPRADWLNGAPAILYDRCDTCSAIWYLPRITCPQCGGREICPVAATGRGVVSARTLVHRAPTPELKAIVPYLLVFIEAEEGFRLMAHGDPDLQIGDAVEAHFRMRPDRLVPFFVLVPEDR